MKFKKEKNVPIVRPIFRAMLIIDPNKPLDDAMLQPIEGDIQLIELAMVLAKLHDNVLLEIGRRSKDTHVNQNS